MQQNDAETELIDLVKTMPRQMVCKNNVSYPGYAEIDSADCQDDTETDRPSHQDDAETVHLFKLMIRQCTLSR